MTAEYKFIIDTGVVSVDTSDLRDDVIDEWKDALGQNLDTDASTPQGTMIQAEVVARSSVMRNNAELANMINPNYAFGTWIDAIAALLGVTRGRNISTVGTGVLMEGNPGTQIPLGARVRTTDGDLYTVQAAVSIGSNRQVLATIASSDFGPIALPTGPLQIVDNVIGWTNATVNSQTTVVLGTMQSNDGQLKTRRNMQLFRQGLGSTGAIQAALLDVPNVTSCQVIENNTGAPGTIHGVEFSLPNAVWVCVAGNPNPQSVADALYKAHQGGCPWDYGAAGNGNPVSPPNGLQATDEITDKKYYVKFTTAIMFDCYVNITCVRAQSSASQIGIQNAVVNYANGLLDGESGLIVGASVSAFEISGAVARSFPGLYIKSCSVAVVPRGAPAPLPEDFVSEFPMLPYQQAQVQLGNIIVELT